MSNHMPLVSVVIPAFNDEAFIGETLSSVLSQTYKNLEIVVVDDGSCDNTPDIVRSHDDCIRLLQVENGGPAKARNAGIKACSGDYIAFLDADDIWLPDKLEKQIKMFKHNTGLVYSNRFWIDAEGNFQDNPPVQNNFPSGSIFNEMIHANYFVTSSVVISKQVIEQVGLFDESETFLNCQDYQYWLRICSKFDVEGTKEKLIKYRVHESNRHKNFARRLKGMIGCLDTAAALSPESINSVKDRKFHIYSSYAATFLNIGDYQNAREAYLSAGRLGKLSFGQLVRLYLTYSPHFLLNSMKNIRNIVK